MKDQSERMQRQIFMLDRPYSSEGKNRVERIDRAASEAQGEQRKRTRGAVHFTWDQAWRAESEREQARLSSCNDIPTAGPFTLFAANVARELPKIKARAFRYFSWMAFKRRASAKPQSQTAVPKGQSDSYVIMDSEEAPAPQADSTQQPIRWK